MPVVVTAHAKTKQLLCLQDAPAAQLLDGHSRHRDRAGATTLGFLLADGAGVGLLGAGNDGELSGLQVDRVPAQPLSHRGGSQKLKIGMA